MFGIRLDRIRRFRSLVSALLLAQLLALPAGAQESVTLTDENGRYEMQPVEGGVARLDTRTGALTLCRVERDGLVCRPSEGLGGAGAVPRDAVADLSERIDEIETRLELFAGRMRGLERRLTARLRQREPVPLDEMRETLRGLGQIFRDMDREFGRGAEPRDRAAPEEEAVPDRL